MDWKNNVIVTCILSWFIAQFIKVILTLIKDKKIDLSTLNDLIKQAYSIEDQSATRAKTYRQAYNTAGASKSVEQTNAKEYTATINKLAKKYNGSFSRAKAAYNRGER